MQNTAPTPERQAQSAPDDHTPMPIPHFLETLLDRPIAFHCVFAELTQSVNAGIMLSQAVYWSKRTKDAEGWFYKSQAEWQQETYLTREKQDSARARLRSQAKRRNLPPFWYEERRGLPARVFYRIDFDALSQHLFALHQQYAENPHTERSVQPDLTGTSAQDDVEKPQTRLRKKHNLERGKNTIKRAEKTQSGTREKHNPSLQRLHAETTSRRSSARARANGSAAAASRFTELEILDYLSATKPHNAARNGGLAHKLYLTGEDDHLIARWKKLHAPAAAEPDRDFLVALDLADNLLAAHSLDSTERQLVPGLIETLSTSPDHGAVVEQLKGLTL